MSTKSRLINKQVHKNSCGPTALANVLKWQGYKTSHKEMVQFCKGLGTYDPKVGMYPGQIRLSLKKLEISFRPVLKSTLALIDGALDKNQPILFTYRTSKGSHHIIFIDKKLESFYQAWNITTEKAGSPRCTRRFLSNALRRSMRHDGYCRMYIILP